MAWQRSFMSGGMIVALSNVQAQPIEPKVIECVACGTVCPPGRRKLCGSRRCTNLANRDSRNKRRAIERGVATERYTRTEIADQHDWTCALCGDEIPKDLHYLDPLALTIDHITPLTRGGDDLRSNVQPAHRRCNTSKGNRVF
jgi:5-methylcytosine-specific restriction endonuclease McrA